MSDFTDIEINQFFKDKTEFTANGKKFLIIKKTDLSIVRNQHLHAYAEQIIRSTQLEPQNQILSKIKFYLKQGDIFEASVFLGKQLESGQLYKTFPESVLQACATFIVREDEDKSDYSPEISDSKIKDWEKEGIAWEAFFFLVLKYSTQLANNWAFFFRAVSEKLEKVKRELGNQSTTS